MPVLLVLARSEGKTEEAKWEIRERETWFITWVSSLALLNASGQPPSWASVSPSTKWKALYLPIWFMSVKKDTLFCFFLLLFFFGGWGGHELSVLIRKENLTHVDVQFYSSLSLIFQRTLCFWENLDCVTYLLLIWGAPGLEASLHWHGGVGGVSKGRGLGQNKQCQLGSVFPIPKDSRAFWHMPRNLLQFMGQPRSPLGKQM